jgi:hypothetical protein
MHKIVIVAWVQAFWIRHCIGRKGLDRKIYDDSESVYNALLKDFALMGQ